ncbi:MAG: flagellar hook-length control protein FliK [Burkholderiales bacterium]|nr:flagellar hook-length control protein FliK [Burkholderiales bacterium]
MTMQVTNPVSPVTAAAPVAAARPADSTKNAFASLLRQSRSAQAAPPEAPAQGADAAAAGVAETADAPVAPNAPSKARLKAADKGGPQRPAERGPKAADAREPTPETGPEAHPGNTRAQRSEVPVGDPAAAPWLAAAHQPLPAEVTAARRPDEADAATAPVDDPVAGTKADDTAALRDKAIGDAQARLESATASQQALAPWAGSTRADSAATQGVGKALAEDSRSLKSVATEPAPAAAALGAAAFNPLLGAARESAAPLAVNLPTPLASPEFAQALGVQMSVLAADGVQRAELQLNPAEMGPVSVQIVIEGTSARVDFGADLAATRHAIEAGLPELAGALRDAGFTLTGGGVSQHSGGRHASPDTPGDTGHGPRRDADAGDAPPRAVPQRRVMSAGGVDLYA